MRKLFNDMFNNEEIVLDSISDTIEHSYKNTVYKNVIKTVYKIIHLSGSLTLKDNIILYNNEKFIDIDYLKYDSINLNIYNIIYNFDTYTLVLYLKQKYNYTVNVVNYVGEFNNYVETINSIHDFVVDDNITELPPIYSDDKTIGITNIYIEDMKFDSLKSFHNLIKLMFNANKSLHEIAIKKDHVIIDSHYITEASYIAELFSMFKEHNIPVYKSSHPEESDYLLIHIDHRKFNQLLAMY